MTRALSEALITIDKVGLCVGRVNKRPKGGPYTFFDASEVQKGTRGVPEHPRHPMKVFVDQFSGKYRIWENRRPVRCSE